MAYITHNFVDGEILYAQPLNEMDEQILLNSQIVSPEAETKKITEFSMLGGMSRKGKNLINIQQTITWYHLPSALPSGTYTLSMDNDREALGFRMSNSTDTSHDSVSSGTPLVRDGRKYITLTTTFETNYINISSDGETGVELTNLMLETGNTPTSYEPYTPNLIDGKVDDVISYGKNLLKPTLEATTQNGVTCTKNSDDTYTLNGTASATCVFVIANYTAKVGTKMLGKTDNNNLYYLIYMPNNSYTNASYDTLGNGVVINNVGTNDYIKIIVTNGTTLNNAVVKPMLTTDTSLTYNDYVPYQENHYPIPQAIQELDGYGIGINNDVYNYLEFKDGRTYFHKRVGVVDLGTPNWQYASSTQSMVADNFIIGRKLGNTLSLTSKYKQYIEEIGGTTTSMESGTFAYQSNLKNRLVIRDLSYTDPNLFKQSLQGQKLYYELETETITDVTDKMSGLIVPNDGRFELHYPLIDLYSLDIPYEETTSDGYLDTIYHDGKPVYPKTLASQVIGLDSLDLGLKMDLLWTNAIPESPFIAQTVNINLEPYKLIIIHYKNSRLEEPIFAQTNIVGTKGILFSTEANQAFILFRKFVSSGSGITFEEGRQNTSTSSNTAWVVPYSIYGVK